ncbi:MAG TPA: hypothetical protein VH639_05365 [Bryobacteraceae bacterium]|jgi:hypothetical protein
MKTKLNALLLTAAGLTLSAAAVYGQSRVVANIPFAFRTIGGMQAAGQYAVAHEGPTTKLTNLESGKSTLAGFGTPADVSAKAKPQLVFICGSESGCALSAVTDADGRTTSFKAPHLKASETAHVAVVQLESRQAE